MKPSSFHSEDEHILDDDHLNALDREFDVEAFVEGDFEDRDLTDTTDA